VIGAAAHSASPRFTITFTAADSARKTITRKVTIKINRKKASWKRALRR